MAPWGLPPAALGAAGLWPSLPTARPACCVSQLGSEQGHWGPHGPRQSGRQTRHSTLYTSSQHLWSCLLSISCFMLTYTGGGSWVLPQVFLLLRVALGHSFRPFRGCLRHSQGPGGGLQLGPDSILTGTARKDTLETGIHG